MREVRPGSAWQRWNRRRPDERTGHKSATTDAAEDHKVADDSSNAPADVAAGYEFEDCSNTTSRDIGARQPIEAR